MLGWYFVGPSLKLRRRAAAQSIAKLIETTKHGEAVFHL